MFGWGLYAGSSVRVAVFVVRSSSKSTSPEVVAARLTWRTLTSGVEAQEETLAASSDAERCPK